MLLLTQQRSVVCTKNVGSKKAAKTLLLVAVTVVRWDEFEFEFEMGNRLDDLHLFKATNNYKLFLLFGAIQSIMRNLFNFFFIGKHTQVCMYLLYVCVYI